eukprot:EG_transcript_19153
MSTLLAFVNFRDAASRVPGTKVILEERAGTCKGGSSRQCGRRSHCGATEGADGESRDPGYWVAREPAARRQRLAGDAAVIALSAATFCGAFAGVKGSAKAIGKGRVMGAGVVPCGVCACDSKTYVPANSGVHVALVLRCMLRSMCVLALCVSLRIDLVVRCVQSQRRACAWSGVGCSGAGHPPRWAALGCQTGTSPTAGTAPSVGLAQLIWSIGRNGAVQAFPCQPIL